MWWSIVPVTVDPEIVFRLSFERKICLLVSNWHFFITLVKAVLTLSRNGSSLSIFSRDRWLLLLRLEQQQPTFRIPVFITLLYIGTGLLFLLLVIYSITLCCVAEFLAPLLIDSLISLKYAFGVLRNGNFSIHYFFRFEVQPVILPLKTAFKLSHRMPCVISTILCLKEILYFPFHIFKIFISWNWVIKSPCNIWPSWLLARMKMGHERKLDKTLHHYSGSMPWFVWSG